MITIAVNSRDLISQLAICKSFIHDNLQMEHFVLWDRQSMNVFSFKFPFSKPRSSVCIRNEKSLQVTFTLAISAESLRRGTGYIIQPLTLCSLFGLCFVQAKPEVKVFQRQNYHTHRVNGKIFSYLAMLTSFP